MMDSNRFGTPQLSAILQGHVASPVISAEPINDVHNDVDLSLVKQELPDYCEQEQGPYAMDTTSGSHCVSMETERRGIYAQQNEVSSTTALAVGVKRPPGRRGRKPILKATGKNGEKLEKRREQNRRAAATYRKKMNNRKTTIEQDHARLEEENKIQKQEVEALKKQKAELEEILLAHKSADCKLFQNNNNNSFSLLSNFSMCNISANNTFLNNDSFLNPQYALENPLEQITHLTVQPTRDQTLAPSPYTPKTEQMFTFDGHCGEPIKSLSPTCRSFSPASSQLSASPAPDVTSYAGQSRSLPIVLPSISSVINGAQAALAPMGDPTFDPVYLNAVDDFLSENNPAFNDFS